MRRTYLSQPFSDPPIAMENYAEIKNILAVALLGQSLFL